MHMEQSTEIYIHVEDIEIGWIMPYLSLLQNPFLLQNRQLLEDLCSGRQGIVQVNKEQLLIGTESDGEGR